jgi:hypothetical protein
LGTTTTETPLFEAMVGALGAFACSPLTCSMWVGAVIRVLAFLFLGFVVAWDFVSSGPKDAAITRASAQLYRWVRDEIAERELLDAARRALADMARAYQASRGPEVAAIAAPEPILVEALPEIATPDAAAIAELTTVTQDLTSASGTASTREPAPAIEAGEQLVVGDSVFAKDAILAFIAEASERTGVSAGYLEALALRESSFNPVAASDHSTARGLYQFIESTWLDVFARHGGQHGQGDLAALVTTDGARPDVSDGGQRDRILNLRYDPKLSTFLAARLASDNREGLEAALDRPVSDAELYIAHFLGLAGARTLIETNLRRPNADAADLFPWAARSNRSYFYDGRRHRTVAEVYDALLLQAGEIGENQGTIASLESTTAF